MARIRIEIDDPAIRLTLKAMLEAEGHVITPVEGELCIAESARRALEVCRQLPTLVLSTMPNVAEAVQAMRRGVYGYILLPLVPGEASVMVQRALGGAAAVAAGASTTPAKTAKRLDEVERAHIEAVLRQCKHNQAEAARLLGIGRNTLWRKLKQYSEAV